MIENQLQSEQVEKPARVYRVRHWSASRLWTAEFRPINSKTGKPWQASRMIVTGNVVHELSNHQTGESVIRPGLPSRENLFENGRWTRAEIGYASREDALAAIEIYEQNRN